LVTDNTSAISSKIGEYSYNWPYDYFSLVELVKVEEGIQYISKDLKEAPATSMEIAAPIDVNVVSTTTGER